MSLKFLKPVTSSQRGVVIVDKKHLWKGKPYKKLSQRISKKAGRNCTGVITVRHQGGGKKRIYRQIDFIEVMHKNLLYKE